jgi:aspartate kinase
MKPIVSKFGGSSVADGGQIRKVREILLAEPDRRIIIVSAPGKRTRTDEKITDNLIACHALNGEGKDFRPRFEIVRTRYREIAGELGLGSDLDPVLDEVEQSIAAGAPRDAVVSRGEYLGAHLIAQFIGFEFADAADLIRFADETTIDDEATDRLCRERLHPTGRYVIPGFYGAYADGSIQLFTRGGSDISGALVARALGASRYENWTDVSGLLSADPRVVNNPDPIDEVSYHELRELAYLGANVFHDEAVAPVATEDIPINIRNTNEPDHPGTMILSRDRRSTRRPGKRTGVAGKTGYTGIVVRKSMINKLSNLPGTVGTILGEAGIRVHQVILGADSMMVVVESAALDAAGSAILEEIRVLLSAAAVERTGPYALVGAVGEKLAIRPSVLGAVLAALENEKMEVHLVVGGYSESSFVLAVDENRYEDAIRVLYAATQ